MNETAYYLHEIPAGAIFSPKGSKECAPIVLNHNNELFTAVIPRFENHGDTSYDRIYSRYIIVAEFLGERAFASSAKYATYISTKWSIPVILPRNKKGLGDFRAGLFDTDLDDLGISFITINIKINDFLCASPRKGNTAFHYGCKLYYINTSCIEQYDAAILEAYKRNIIVSAVVLVNTAIHSFDPEIGAILQHPEYEPAGHYSMPDTTTPESVQVYLAALNYLAERYTRADGRYGHIHRWIVHNEIDAGWIWCNAGKKTMNQYAEEYLRSLRLVWLTMKKYDSNAKVFIPLTHNWNISFSENCFPASKMLESIHTISQAEGDFDWGIALHSYPQLLWDPRSWRDNLAYNDLTTTPLITFKNIEIIDQWIHSKELLFQGKPRVLMLTEQNPNSVDYSEREQMMQAVSLCYIWQKIKSIDSIEAYIAHCWIDNHTEGGLKTGLRKYPNDLEDPCGKKDSWYAYKDFGTEKEIAILELSGEIIKRDYDQ